VQLRDRCQRPQSAMPSGASRLIDQHNEIGAAELGGLPVKL
jgi:hypothetical protein